VSGPVSTADAAPVPEPDVPSPGVLEILESRETRVGDMPVRRALPRRAHRTVGAWCFADHMGPASVTETRGVDIGPHPHIGLQTVTWLVTGEILHRDGLGTEQVVTAGQLNLMTAGRGVAHSEEVTGRYRGELHGIQLWVAQPEQTRHGDASFEHHADLPRVDVCNGTATVIVGEVGDARSPARRDTDHAGIELDLRPGRSVVELRPDYEHALVVLDGRVALDGTVVEDGRLAYLGTRRDELAVEVREPARAVLLGGVPFPDEVLMWWNFVARTRDEVVQAYRSWEARDERFTTVASPLARIDAPQPQWLGT
jgi:redox-sensitive bicupin YhaK (pirin superfamily)